ncbi:hypothetical protein ISN44_As07g016730 [Arabidopsis suecica]|uniref:Uncharacterized protein n=1 Tax=Arabidopsis suecica TaxID=45249 RepID=A0A8T2BPC9_ARASU|nr:hypothetical protein ISN44_As07g016730 [Arabidopsis suecica]
MESYSRRVGRGKNFFMHHFKVFEESGKIYVSLLRVKKLTQTPNTQTTTTTTHENSQHNHRRIDKNSTN